MDPDRWRQIAELYDAGLARPKSERSAFLRTACAGDPELAREVKSLLDQSTSAAFLGEPAMGAAARLIKDQPDGMLIGRRLGIYEIRSLLGVGGMGEVYRARDTKLGRDVAIKVLPPIFTADRERLDRFEREARVLAALNHSHIGSIYGVEESGGAPALVLELVEGPTLAERIAKGPIPVDEALPIARQIADALDFLHEKGIVHRDLKPSNIKITPDGIVKVLDFGLAKVLAGEATGSDFSQSPTITLGATREGVLLGTAAYVSPEQARGQAIDKRADIWAFGCVLFEMLTGKRAFEGDNLSDTLAAVLKGEPDWNAWPAQAPVSVRVLAQRCLEKDRTQRIADVTTVLFVVDNLVTGPPPVIAPAARSSRVRLAWTIAGVLAIVSAVAASAVVYVWRSPLDRQTYRSTLVAAVASDAGQFAPLALSSDGRRLAFVGLDRSSHSLLYVRNLDGLTDRPLSGTEGAADPFWSADSHAIAFFANNKLKTIDVDGGGLVSELCDAVSHFPGTWNRDNVILFTPSGGALFRVLATGGTPSPVTALDSKTGETTHAFPLFLPDGRHFLYLAQTSGVPHGVYVSSLDSTERIRLLEGGSNVQYAEGALLFLRGTTLMAQRFDAGRLALDGQAVPLADHLLVSETSSALRTGAFGVSNTGVLVYRADASGGSLLTWFDRGGNKIGQLGERAKYLDVALSPDAAHASVSVMEPSSATRDLLIYDVRGNPTRFTFDPEDHLDAHWSPNSSRLAFAARRKGHLDLYEKASNGAGTEQLLYDGDDLDKYPQSWSPDGRYLLYVSVGAKTTLWLLPLTGSDRRPAEFLHAEYSVGTGQFSPNGDWVVYRSYETGHQEIYVTPFPGRGYHLKISTAGGNAPRWRGDGKAIFYVTPGNVLMEVPVTLEGTHAEVGTERQLFQLHPVVPRYSYDVSADGKRFLVNTADDQAASAPLTLVVNWRALLK